MRSIGSTEKAVGHTKTRALPFARAMRLGASASAVKLCAPSDTNFFVCSLVRRYRIDALALPPACFAPHCGSRTAFCHAQRTLW